MNTRIGWHIVQSVIQRDVVTSLDLIHFTIEIIIQVVPAWKFGRNWVGQTRPQITALKS